MTSLPKEIVDEYLAKHHIPEILSKEHIQKHSATLQDLLAYCDTLIDFLEKNQIYKDPYSVKPAVFEAFYSILSQYYKTSTDPDQLFKLIRAEQTIHLITHTVNTQDISPYLAILEDVCNGKHLNELIFLLSKKHCASSKDFNSNYRKWIKFLTPYLKFLVKMDFDYFKIFHLANEKDALLKDYLSELKESLSKRSIIINSEISIQEIKERFLEIPIAEKDEDYYYEFGLIMFILHLTSYPENPEFFKICIALESYIGTSSSVHLNGLIEPEYLNALRTSERNVFAQSAKKLLSSMSNSPSSPKEFELLGLSLEIFLKTNVFYEENDSLEKILKAIKSEKNLLLTLKSPYCGEHITQYEYLVRLVLLVIYKGIHFKFPTPEQKEKFLEFAKTLFEQDFDTQGLRPYIKEKYYDVIHLLISPTKFMETWNLSKIPLETLIMRQQDIQEEDLFLNLKFSLKFMESNPTEKNQIQALSDLLRTYISTVETHKHHSSSPITTQLKTTSIFLLKIFNLNIVFPKDLKIQFLHSFTNLVANKCLVNEWDVLDFQADYWKTLQSTSSTKTVVLEKAFERFFEIVEENLAKASIEANCEYQDRSYIREAEISSKLDNLVLASLERIESSLTTQWYLINWKNALDPQVQQKVLKLKLDCKTFIYSTQKWLVYLLDNNKFQHAEAFDPKFTNILLKLSHLYFHPAFLLLTDAIEQKKFLEAYPKIVDQNKFIRWNTRIVFFGTLGHRVTFLNRMFHSDIKPQASKEQVLYLDLPQIRENLFSKNQPLNKETILYTAIMKRISQLPDILRGFDGCSMDETAQNQYSDMLKKLSSPLTDFILNVFSVETKAPLESDPLLRAILKGMESILKPPHSVFSAFNAIQSFFCQLLQNGFRNNLPTSISSKMLQMILVLNGMLKGRLKEALLCISICQGTPINEIIKVTSNYIDYKIGKTSDGSPEKDMKMMHQLALHLTDYFHNQFKTICSTLEAFKFGSSPQDFEKNLFNSLVTTLNSLQAQEIILYQNSQTDEIFAGVLQILEKCFIALKKDVIKTIQPIQDEIKLLESNLEEDFQEFESLFGDDEPATQTVVLNVEEVNQKIKDQIAFKTKQLEQVRGDGDEIDRQFFHSLQYFILIYPFAEAKKSWSSILTPIQEKSLDELTQLLNNLIQNISTQNGFIKILNFTPDHSLNVLLTIQGCLNRLLAFLQRPEGDYSVQESFIWNLIAGTSTLFSDFYLKTQNFDRFVETVQDLIANTCKLILTYLTCKYLSDSAQISLDQDQIKSFSQWLRNTLNLYCFLSEHPQSKISIYNDPTLLNILGMLQILSDSLDFVDLISTILNTKTKKLWTVTLTYFMACVLEKPLQNGLPEDQLILTQIKKTLSGAAYLTSPITNLGSDPLIIEKENTSQEKLLAVLENKFKITSQYNLNQVPDLSMRLSSQNLTISFDLTQEDISPQSSIESVLSQISPNAHKILKALFTSILKNHLFNLNNQDDPSLLKETNSIVTMISILAQKFSYIAAYIAFFKDDYTHSIDKEEFKSITFLECLFKLKFFRLNGHSFLMLLKPLISSIGIVYRDPESSDTLIDVSKIVTLKCLEFIQEEVKDLAGQEDSLSSVERYFISKFSIAALGYINFVIQQLQQKFKLLDHIRNLLNNVLKSIIQSLKFLFRNPSVQQSILEDILSGLHTNFFDSRYAKFCSEASSNSARIDALKFDYYEEFLTNQASDDSQNIPKQLSETLDVQVTTLLNNNNNHTTCHQKPYVPERFVNIFKRENRNEAKVFPFINSSTLYGNVTWVNYLKSLTSNINKLLNDSPELLTSTINLELPTEKFEFNLPNLYNIKSVPFLDVKKTLLKISTLSQQTETRFYQTISQNLIQKATLQQKPQEVAVQVNPNIQEQQPKSQIQSMKCLKYFTHTSLKSEADLQNAETQVKIKIKILSERILVESIPLSVTTSLVAEKIIGELSKMDDFERNLLLCHLGQYQISANFKFPENFAEIFEEFTWIHNNFKTYLEILQALSPQQREVAPPQILENDHLESLDELIFCKSYDLNVPPTGQTVLPFDLNLKKNLYQLHNLYPIDDDVVESLASSFYLVFSQETPVPLTGLLNELCNSAPFQIKLLDFCFFFLYSPDFLGADKFPYETICDLKSRSKLPLDQNYEKVAQNILKFLIQHIKQRIYLVCQPKTYLDQYGLKNLQELKLKTNYKDVTREFISIGDLLIGLLGIKEVNSNTPLLQELQNLLKVIFTQKIQFKIWDSKQSAETPFGEKKMLTVKSCKAILKMSPIDFILTLWVREKNLLKELFSAQLQNVHPRDWNRPVFV